MKSNDIKSMLVNEINCQLKNYINDIKRRMKEAQEEANEHKGAMESRYDTFKEEAQYRRSGFEKQLQSALIDLKVFREIDPSAELSSVQIGAVVKAEEENIGTGEVKIINYFISIGCVARCITLNELEFTIISPTSPIGVALLLKEEGDVVNVSFSNNKKTINIIEIY